MQQHHRSERGERGPRRTADHATHETRQQHADTDRHPAQTAAQRPQTTIRQGHQQFETTGLPLAGAQVVQRDDHQQRQQEGRDERQIETPHQRELRVGDIRFVDLTFQREHADAVLPRHRVALTERRERER